MKNGGQCSPSRGTNDDVLHLWDTSPAAAKVGVGIEKYSSIHLLRFGDEECVRHLSRVLLSKTQDRTRTECCKRC